MASPESPAQGVIPGCPRGYNFLRSSAFLASQGFLYGRSRVHLNVPASGSAQSGYLTWYSHFLPATFYACLQRHKPYSEEQLCARRIMREAADVVEKQADQYADGAESDKAFQRRVWRLLTRMRGDQKWYSLRFGSWLLTHMFRWLFNGEIYVDPQACEPLRALAGTSTFVCVPHPL